MEQNILATACGRVQGVGFRYFVQRQATALGICGWVKNCEDGSVRKFLDSLLGPAASLAASLPALLPKVCGKFIFLSDNVDIQTARRL